ncbi:MAG TPA: amidohydrolase [Clostridia bacterium]|nr:MAG: 5-methylthioadenosine/S-adenosylhomocysteine deaminase [Firmicutes bacterium ADurb.Bin146]HOD92853.1 amidohydrolase [Clostridia bacterium]HQM39003.1 amidohydrolase [Clostridia bacterium]
MNTMIKNADILTMDDDFSILKNQVICIEDDRIVYIGEDEPFFFLPNRIINAKNKIVMPGLINSHTHCAMTLMRNRSNDLPLERWLQEGIFPIEANLTYKDVYSGAMLGIAEMIKCGTTAYLDMYYIHEASIEAISSSGIRANLSYGVSTSSKVKELGKQGAEEYCKNFILNNRKAFKGRLNTSIEVHSVYLVDENELILSAQMAKDTETLIHIHLHETQTEVNNCIKKYGMTPLQLCEKTGILENKVTAAHTVHVNDEDMQLMKKRKVIPVHNPSSNMLLGSGFADIPKMLQIGLKPALGTDGAASNNTIDMFKEMHITALIHKGYKKDSNAINAKQVLTMATANGAKALGFDNCGMIKVGMKADIAIVNTDSLNMSPYHDSVSALVYSARATDVDTVLVNGEILMKDRKLLTIDEEKVKYEALKSAERLYNLH